ncbi:MAG: UvrD-helicase domain-containing protein [Candidatus Cloacimonadia bacterium]
MNKQLKRIIKASAGTGKTYRLSLEFVNLLLEYRGIKAEEILVITFTRKATAEIRDSIFSHLEKITERDETDQERKVLINNLSELFNKTLTPEDVEYLKGVKDSMLFNKHKLQVSTIDSFVHYIFQSVIAPYLGLNDFEIDNEINSKYYPQIYQKLFSKEAESKKYLQVFSTKRFKTIELYDGLLKSIIENRWLFHLIEEKGYEDLKEDSSIHHNNYVRKFTAVLDEFVDYLKDDGKDEKPVKYVFKTDFHPVLPDKDNAVEGIEELKERIKDIDYIQRNWAVLSNRENFWNGNRCLNGKANRDKKDRLLEDYMETLEHLYKYLYIELLQPEQKMILDLAKEVLSIYDEIKMREKVLTYSDVAYYTFTNLYNPELSLIDPTTGEVYNRFYEFLSGRIRFILIDEFQDTSILQFRILHPIIMELLSGAGAKEYGGVIVVGDEKQSIYGWRGGERNLLLKMSDIISLTEVDSLTDTYRSSEFIISFINDLFTNVTKAIRTKGVEWNYSDKITSKTKETGGYWEVSFYNEAEVGEEEDDNKYQSFVREVVKPALEGNKREPLNPADSVILARTNNDLKEISFALEEEGIGYLLESSSPIVEHSIIKPIVYLLNFFAKKEIISLLEFLRSDYSLITAEELRRVMLVYNKATKQNEPLLEAFGKECSDIVQLQKILALEKQSDKSILELILDILEEFNVLNTFEQDQYMKILHLFVEIVADFENDNRVDTSKSIFGFLSYLEDRIKSEELKQISLESNNTIQLMTFHKAKGLQFNNVFVFNQRSKGTGGFGQNIELLYKMNENYTKIEDFQIVYNYLSVVKNDKNNLLYRNKYINEIQEELNNLYVALTRAKTNLYLFLVFKNTGGIKGYLKPKKEDDDKIDTPRLFYNSVVKLLNDRELMIETDPEERLFTIRDEAELKVQQSVESSSTPLFEIPYNTYFRPLRKDNLKSKDHYHPKYSDLGNYLQNKQNLIGNIAHYYLAHIKYGDAQELVTATNKTISFYGNLATVKTINDIIEQCNNFISCNSDLFDTRWTKVFNEFSLFNDYGKEFRVDRIMIDNDKKEILIVDYKTGGIGDEKQVENYRDILRSIPFIEQNDFEIKTRYVSIPDNT